MNVFLIQTATQLLNAIEAKHYLNLKECHLIVFLAEEYPREAYKGILNEDEWKSVHYLSTAAKVEKSLLRFLKYSEEERIRAYFRTWEIYLLRKKLDKMAKSFGPIKNVFLGNHWIDYMRHFANKVLPQKLYLLDDGTATLLINKVRRERLLTKRHFSLKALKDKIIDHAVGLMTLEPEKVTFFTTYDLQVAPGDEVIKNDYRYLKNVATKRSRTDEVFFLGQTLIDEGFSREHYLYFLDKIKQYYSNQVFVYVPHKSEPVERVKYIKETMRITVKKLDVPIEFHLTMNGLMPKALSSFSCSALETCRVIFGDQLNIQAFYVDPEYFPLRPDFMRDIYAYYQSKANPNFKVVKLD